MVPRFVFRFLALLVLLAGLFGLFVLDASNYSALHTAAAHPVDSDPYSSIVSLGDLEVTPPEHDLLRGDPVSPTFWDLVFMYSVSVVALGWTAARAINRWRFDRHRLAFEPRDRPRVRLSLARLRRVFESRHAAQSDRTWGRD